MPNPTRRKYIKRVLVGNFWRIRKYPVQKQGLATGLSPLHANLTEFLYNGFV